MLNTDGNNAALFRIDPILASIPVNDDPFGDADRW